MLLFMRTDKLTKISLTSSQSVVHCIYVPLSSPNQHLHQINLLLLLLFLLLLSPFHYPFWLILFHHDYFLNDFTSSYCNCFHLLSLIQLFFSFLVNDSVSLILPLSFSFLPIILLPFSSLSPSSFSSPRPQLAFATPLLRAICLVGPVFVAPRNVVVITIRTPTTSPAFPTLDLAAPSHGETKRGTERGRCREGRRLRIPYREGDKKREETRKHRKETKREGERAPNIAFIWRESEMKK